MDKITCDDIDSVCDIFREIFNIDIIIAKAKPEEGWNIFRLTHGNIKIEFDLRHNTIIHDGKVMEFNDECVDYLRSLKS